MIGQTLGLISDKPAEMIVVDDGSDDGTWQWLVEEFGTSNDRVKCLRSAENRGPGPARNLGLVHASGEYFLPLDSDCQLTGDGLSAVLEAIDGYRARYGLFFFPCVEVPGKRRMDHLTGNREVTWEDLLYGRHGIRELIPLVALAEVQKAGFRYPDFRVGGESLLWLRLLRESRALFVDRVLLRYGTEDPGRICSAMFQIRHAGELAEVADALLAEFPSDLPPEGEAARRRRLIASGIYHCLAGGSGKGRRNLVSALRRGGVAAVLPLAASFGGRALFRAAFAWYRGRRLAG